MFLTCLGTTIDSIHVPFVFDGDDFIFIDTAGIRKKYKQSHAVEYFSYIRAMHAVDESDIVLMLIDVSDGIVDQDLRISKFDKRLWEASCCGIE